MSDTDTSKDPYDKVSEAARALSEEAGLEEGAPSLLEELKAEEKPEPSTEERIHTALIEILQELKKQDAASFNDAKTQQQSNELLANAGEVLAHMAETQPKVLELLEEIAQSQRKPSIFKRAAIDAAMSLPQMIGSILKTLSYGIAIPTLVALGVHAGNGNDIMDLPDDISKWAAKHNLVEQISAITNPESSPITQEAAPALEAQ